MSVSLNWLLEGIASIPPTAARIADLTLDSRDAGTGSLFLAVKGRDAHGLEFVGQAIARGATVVLWEPHEGQAAPAVPQAVFAAPIPGLRKLLGPIAARFFGEPSARLRIFGITGTNGKTTCAYLLAQCLERMGSPAAYAGTIGSGRIGSLAPPRLTTPDAVSLQRTLAQLLAQGVRDVALEVSSHALDQDRVAGVRFFCAAFTNLSRDHLDYHGSIEDYGEAKARLFTADGLQHIVVNVNDAFGLKIARRHAGDARLTAVWIGENVPVHASRTLAAVGVHSKEHGVALDLDGSFGKASLQSRLIGRFNAENAVLVLACLTSAGIALAQAVDALAGCTPPPGRMELIEPAIEGKPAAVIDYAHTPDALAKALSALREHCRGALWCVFGCGGDRDHGKRPMMGAVADELADEIIVTDDNPRSESPEAITRAIISGITSRAVRVIHDRARAIGTALGEAASIDLVLIAGKGHEDYQIYGQTRRPFSDRCEALRHLGAAA